MSYYGADGRLRAADARQVRIADDGHFHWYRTNFDEYFYDALGRRVLVRSRRHCAGTPVNNECVMDFVRRTVWDGDQELWEIQMPTDQSGVSPENDTAPLGDRQQSGNGGAYVDPNPYWGRVAYTHGAGLDQPLSVTRFGYGDQLTADVSFRALAPFSIIPLWDLAGTPVVGTYGSGERVYAPGGRPISATWPFTIFAYQRDKVTRTSWHGTLLEDKRDFTGTSYRRNRYYDGQTGRFTQEDPIGLAGGLNAYGFANGDPVGYSDPYGLSPEDQQPGPRPSARMRGCGQERLCQALVAHLERRDSRTMVLSAATFADVVRVAENDRNARVTATVPARGRPGVDVRVVSFYGTKYENAIGSGSLLYKDGEAIGFRDTWDFEPRPWTGEGSRGIIGELKTRAAAASLPPNTPAFRVIYDKPETTTAQ
jgi:RHS repeat-associated protein